MPMLLATQEAETVRLLSSRVLACRGLILNLATLCHGAIKGLFIQLGEKNAQKDTSAQPWQPECTVF